MCVSVCVYIVCKQFYLWLCGDYVGGFFSFAHFIMYYSFSQRKQANTTDDYFVKVDAHFLYDIFNKCYLPFITIDDVE